VIQKEKNSVEYSQEVEEQVPAISPRMQDARGSAS